MKRGLNTALRAIGAAEAQDLLLEQLDAKPVEELQPTATLVVVEQVS
jgi:hypothetical protein